MTKRQGKWLWRHFMKVGWEKSGQWFFICILLLMLNVFRISCPDYDLCATCDVTQSTEGKIITFYSKCSLFFQISKDFHQNVSPIVFYALFYYCCTIFVWIWAPIVRFCTILKNSYLEKFPIFWFLQQNCCISSNFLRLWDILCKA